jgi:hypothetical protein
MSEEQRKANWKIRDLVTDHKTGKLRETALWSNVGKAAMKWAFIYTVYQQKANFNELLWLAYGSIVVAHELTSRYFNQKQQLLDKDSNAQPTRAI